MKTEEIKALDKKYYMNTFGDRLPVSFDSGKGIELYSNEGDTYYDFLGGIAVNALGHSHPKLVAAIQKQAAKVLHTSSLYYIENQARLAEYLVKNTCADKAFFCSTGAEANEGAYKLARKYHYAKGDGKYEIITLDHSFHGRTIATVAATGQEKYQKPYRPLPPGFVQVEPNSLDAVMAAITDKTGAIQVEPIQGESGVYPMDKEYLEGLRRLCDEWDIVLIFDEVQTGMGRTGKLFASEYYGVYPDIFTSAKALGGGVPIGAVLAKDKFCAFEPGDHGTTFGGNPLATAAGCAVFEIYEEEKILENTQKMSAYFMERLNALKTEFPDKITDIRGAGLLIGIELNPDIAKNVFDEMFRKKYLTSLCGGRTIRIAPPLIIKESDIDGFTAALAEALGEY